MIETIVAAGVEALGKLISVLVAAGLSREQILQHVTGVLDGYGAAKRSGDERMRAAWEAEKVRVYGPGASGRPAEIHPMYAAGYQAALAASAPGSEQLYEDAETKS
jgi:hypothetical protein